MDDVTDFQNKVLNLLEGNYNRYGLRGQEWHLAWNAWNTIQLFQERAKKLFFNINHDLTLKDIWEKWSDYPPDKILLIVLFTPLMLYPMVQSLDVSLDMQQFNIPDKNRKDDYEMAISIFNNLKKIHDKYGPNGNIDSITGIIQDMSYSETQKNLPNKFMDSMLQIDKQLKELINCFQEAINGQKKRLPYRKKDGIKKTIAIQVAMGLAEQQKRILGKPLYYIAGQIAHLLTFPEEDFYIDENTLRSMAAR